MYQRDCEERITISLCLYNADRGGRKPARCVGGFSADEGQSK